MLHYLVHEVTQHTCKAGINCAYSLYAYNSYFKCITVNSIEPVCFLLSNMDHDILK